MSDLDDVRDVDSLDEQQLALEKLRHSAAHVMAQAACRLWPGTTLAIGPTIENGFYYDMALPETIGPDDLPRLEEEMRRIAAEDLALVRDEWSKPRALEHFAEDRFKVAILEGIADDTVSVYSQGEFTDLCRGPHLESTSELRHFKLTSVAGAYWRGDERNEMLTRIYGTAFPSAELLEAHLERLEQAAARDHRRLGRELGLFSFHPEAPAMPFFHPKGATLYNTLVDYIRGLYWNEGYSEVITPQIFDTSLWKTSGHYEHFIDNMFVLNADEREFGVKPMNCPSHCLMFSERKWSYRDLPVRLADFGRLHRYERSGATHGLTRVRSMSQDDAHIFCTPDQIAGEIRGVLGMVERVYGDLGLGEPTIYLATRPESALGDADLWERAEAALRTVLDDSARPYELEEGEGAFYGPKIDFFFEDALERKWQLGTIQLDFNLPERFDLRYTSPEDEDCRPVMIHRAVLGTFERFLGVFIEHHAGAFPFWLAPVQARVLPITDEQLEYAGEVSERLREAGIRCEVDGRSEKLGKKIRDAQLEKIPWQLVVGRREAQDRQVSVRLYRAGDQGIMPVDEFVREARDDIDAKAPLPDPEGAA